MFFGLSVAGGRATAREESPRGICRNIPKLGASSGGVADAAKTDFGEQKARDRDSELYRAPAVEGPASQELRAAR